MDQWIGRHMSPVRWGVVWSMVLFACAMGAAKTRPVSAKAALSVAALLALILVWGNARRIR